MFFFSQIFVYNNRQRFLSACVNMSSGVVRGEGPRAYPAHRRIATAICGERSVHVTWDDGCEGALHFMWLRDNCGCAACWHPLTHERTFDLLSVPDDLDPVAVDITEAGALRVTWRGDGHESEYDPAWLRQYGCSAEARAESEPGVILWAAELAEGLPTVTVRGGRRGRPGSTAVALHVARPRRRLDARGAR